MEEPNARSPVATSGGDASVTPQESELTVRNIVIATVCMMGVAFGVTMLGVALGVVLIPMTKEFGWTRTQFSFASTFLTWSGALAAPFVGRVIDRVGVRPVVMVGAVVGGLAAMLLSRQTSNLVTFYAIFAVLGFCAPLSIGYLKVIAALFKRNRGKMLAIFGVETSLSAAIVPWAISQIYVHYGWRMLFLCIGVAMLCLLPLILFIIEEPGSAVRADGSKTPPNAAPTMAGLTLSQIVRTRPFWIIATVAVVLLGPLTGVFPHLIAYLEQKGYPVTVAATYLSFVYLLGFVGSLIAGWALDRFHTPRIVVVSYLSMAIGMTVLLFITPALGLAFLYVAGMFNGLAASSTGPMNTYFHTRFFGLRAFTEVIGVERALTAIAAGIAAPAYGYIYDTTHSYTGVFAFMIFPPLAAAALFMFTGRYRYGADVGTTTDEPAAAPILTTEVRGAGTPAE